MKKILIILIMCFFLGVSFCFGSVRNVIYNVLKDTVMDVIDPLETSSTGDSLMLHTGDFLVLHDNGNLLLQ